MKEEVRSEKIEVRSPDSASPLLLAGPTAVGKSEVALLLGERLGGEIVSVDSMQVYRGLDIGTAKPSATDRARVPHHLIDVAELGEHFDAARFLELARRCVAEIQSRGRLPILCGGTGLYFQAFLVGIGNAPPADAALRAALAATPMTDLLRELAERDPEAFARIDQQNPRRVLRAVEVIRLTGKTFSSQRSEWFGTRKPGAGAAADGLRFFALEREPEDLRRRIDERVEGMFARGLVAETRELMSLGLAENQNAMQAIGYRQVVEHLRGERALTETVELVKTRTRQFAKRQMTWFRRQAQLTWLHISPEESPAETAGRLILSREGGISTSSKGILPE